MNEHQPVSLLIARLESQGMRLWLEDDIICHEGPEPLTESDDFKQIMARVWEAMDTLEKAARPPIPPLTRQKRPARQPIAQPQERFFGAARYTRYEHYSYTYRVRGALNRDALKKALQALVARHETLRTIYLSDAQGTYAKILDDIPVSVSVQRLIDVPAAERNGAIAARAEEFRAAPIDLATGPVFRCQILELAPDDCVLQLVFHYVAADAFSQHTFSNDIGEAYNSVIAGQRATLEKRDLQYADYAIWSHALYREFENAKANVDWAAALKDAPAPVFAKPSPDAVTKRVSVRFSNDFKPKLLEFALANRTDIASVLGFTVGALLARRSALDQCCVGLTCANRPMECSGMVGSFAVAKPIIVDLRGDPTPAKFASRARRAFKDAHDLASPISSDLAQAHDLTTAYLYFGQADKFGDRLPTPPFHGVDVEALHLPRPLPGAFFAEFIETPGDVKGRISYQDGVWTDAEAREFAEVMPLFLERLVDTQENRLSAIWP